MIKLVDTLENLSIDDRRFGKGIESFKEGDILVQMIFHLVDMSLCGDACR
jgi:hypothetical protein